MIPKYNKTKFVELIIEAGNIVNTYFRKEDLAVSLKDKNQPVTVADLECSQFLENSLPDIIPNADICSEESNFKSDNNDFLWLIDPIDGTSAFIEGKPEFAVSVGLAHRDSFLLGAVHNPATGFLAVGDMRSGIYEQINLPEIKKYPSISISRTEAKKNLFSDLEKSHCPFNLYPIHSIAYKLALTACGVFNLTVTRRPKNSWDVAGGLALINAAGKKSSSDNIKNIKCGLFSNDMIAGESTAIKDYEQYIIGAKNN